MANEANGFLDKIPGGQSDELGSSATTLDSIESFRREFKEFTDRAYTYYDDTEDYLKSIADSFRNNSFGSSAASARQHRYESSGSFRNPFNRGFGSFNGSFGSAANDFSEEFKKTLFDAFIGSKFKDSLKQNFGDLAKQMGVDIADIPKALGKNLASEIAKSGFGKKVSGLFDNFINKGMNSLFDAYTSGSRGSSSSFSSIFNAFKSGMSGKGGSFSSFMNNFNMADMAKGTASSGAGSNAASSALASQGGSAIASGAGGASSMATAGSAVSGFASAIGKAIPQVMIIIAILKAAEKVINKVKSAISEVSDGWKSFNDEFNKAKDRDIESRKKAVDAQKQRLQDDMRTLIEEPFNILKEAANEVYDAWDKNVRLINQTQGYNKSELQDLMAVYAQRIRTEGLSKVVSGADITENLSKVLESGLSGQVAEEFAYLATKLNAAIPTQDFFSYGETYASLAATAIAQGKSQADALEYANKQLEAFASSVLYASRELTGGFSTGLKDASDLFTKSVQITQAAKAGNASDIAGVLTAVAGVTGALAPDLVSSMTDSIVKAAVGGNDSSIVALRSLAGINASNTEFLRKLAQDPKQVFSTLFMNLAQMQNMSNANFMEVAEGLSSVFGVSMDAFARIDFTQLSAAIANMSTGNESLNENMALLVSGQSTSTAEQLKMQQINQYMIEEGLSFVVDNAAARMIQEHMWQQQMTREITEAEYGVNIMGGALDLITGIYNFVDKIVMILNPFYALAKTASNLIKTAVDATSYRKDLAEMLKAGEVKRHESLASSAATAFSQLTSSNSSFKVKSLLEMMGHTASYGGSTQMNPWISAGAALLGGQGILGSATYLLPLLFNSGEQTSTVGGVQSPTSRYSWGTIGKSMARLLAASNLSSNAPLSGGISLLSGVNQSSSTSAQVALQKKVDEMLADEYMKQFIGEGKGGYAAWEKSATKFGISNLSEALKSVGYEEGSVKEKFEQQQAQEAAQSKVEREHREDAFWENSIQYHQDMIELLDAMWGSDKKTISDIYVKTGEIYNKTDEFMKAWVDYFINHTAYSKAYDYSEVKEILNREKRGTADAVQALADALLGAEKLEDPQIQTNVLLAQILNTVLSILSKQGGSMTFSLADTLAALSMGGLAE